MFKKSGDLGKISLIIAIVIVCAGLGLTLFAIQKIRATPGVVSSNSSVSSLTADSVKSLLATAFKTDSTWGEPVVTQVSDVVKIKQSDSVFFEKVEKGDWLLIYPTKKKAVLYRESNNQIIKYGDTK